MAENYLNVYKFENGAYTQISENADMTNPIFANIDGSAGGSIIKKYYLRNTDEDYFYINVNLKPMPEISVQSGNLLGLELRLLSGDSEPTSTEWDTVASGNSLISTSDYLSASPKRWYFPELVSKNASGTAIGADNNYYPFWVKWTVPPRSNVTDITSIYFELSATENYKTW